MRIVSRSLAILFLCSICFFPLLRFVAPVHSGDSLEAYLFAFFVHSLVMLGLAWFVNRSSSGRSDPNAWWVGMLLFLSGVVFVGAFGMGAPPRDATQYMLNQGQELVRGVLLILAAILTFAGLLFFWKGWLTRSLNVLGLIYVAILVAALAITLYDFWWGTFRIPADIRLWSEAGNTMSSFFDQYDMRNEVRGVGRVLIYLSTAFTLILCLRLKLVKVWVGVVLLLICLFFLQDVGVALLADPGKINARIGMVPAVALSPAYLLGVYFLSSYKHR